MKSMFTSFNRNFFALVKHLQNGNQFSFQQENFLKDAYDISLDHEIVNEFERGVDGNLIHLASKAGNKLRIKLEGLGRVNISDISKPFSFVSSLMTFNYGDYIGHCNAEGVENDHDIAINDDEENAAFVSDLNNNRFAKHKILFDYLFERHNSPLEDKEPNRNVVENSNDLYCIPIFNVYIKEKKIIDAKRNSVSKWRLILEEV